MRMQLTSSIFLPWRACACLAANSAGSDKPRPVSAPSLRKARRWMPSQVHMREGRKFNMAKSRKKVGANTKQNYILTVQGGWGQDKSQLRPSQDYDFGCKIAGFADAPLCRPTSGMNAEGDCIRRELRITHPDDGLCYVATLSQPSRLKLGCYIGSPCSKLVSDPRIPASRTCRPLQRLRPGLSPVSRCNA